MTGVRRVIVLGADGYLGWPTCLHLSAMGHEVVAVDSLIRRQWDAEGGTSSLIPISSMEQRVACWKALTGRTIQWRRADVCSPEQMDALMVEFKPDAVVHFAEQRSAPFSMIDRDHAMLTQSNNVLGTLNLLFVLRDQAPDCHLIKLGTMGEYGTPNIDIEEGFITVEHNGRSDRLPYPKQPGSYYHLSKVHDSNNIFFATNVWGLRSTDLNQGVVYGVATGETDLHPQLATRFDYDTVWGTVINRFCVQAAVGLPLTVYGQGGQTRDFLDLRDTVACIRLALESPPEPGEYRVFNQFTEQFSVGDLAFAVRDARAQSGLETPIVTLNNPRVEKEQHYYNAKHQRLLDLGLKPHLLGEALLQSIIATVEGHKAQVDPTLLEKPTVDWRLGYVGQQERRAAAPALAARRLGEASATGAKHDVWIFPFRRLSAAGSKLTSLLPRPNQLAGTKWELPVLLACFIALVAIYFGDLLTPADVVVNGLVIIPMLLAAWTMSGRAALAVTLASLSLLVLEGLNHSVSDITVAVEFFTAGLLSGIARLYARRAPGGVLAEQTG